MVQQLTASFPIFNSTSILKTKFPTYDQLLLTEAPVNFIKDANENLNKLTMIKKEYIKKGQMNNEWAEK